TRRSRTTRPKVSTISGTVHPLMLRGAAASLLEPPGPPLRDPDPAAAARPELLLPDGHGRLELVDQLAAAGERLGPVGRRGGHDHARLARSDHPGPGGQGDGAEAVAVRRLAAGPLPLRTGHTGKAS